MSPTKLVLLALASFGSALIVNCSFVFLFSCTNPIMEQARPRKDTPPVVTYTVTFESNGGSHVDSQTIAKGGTAHRPGNPAKTYHTFYNWYADSGLTATFDFSTPIIENTTVYAGWNDVDFGRNVIANTFNVANTPEWNAAISSISGGGNDKNYVINIQSDFYVTGHTAATFGGVSGVIVSLRGVGRTLYLSDNGSILHTGDDQNIILWDLTLRGHDSNNNSLVYVNSGTFTMYGGSISDNTHTTSGGGGVFMYSGGTFIMHGGEISGNTANGNGGGVSMNNGTFTMNGGKISGNTAVGGGGGGGGVLVAGTFIMNGGEISGNTANGYNGNGGGVLSYGNMHIVTGTIYDNTASGAGASLYRFNNTAQYGTFIEGEWKSNGDLTTTNDTIRVVNGVRQP